MKLNKVIGLLIGSGLLISGCSSSDEVYKFVSPESENVEHLHGAGYPNNSDSFFIATHNGLFKYEGGEWTEANSNKHDYMGFSPYKDGFYSSGHPESGSDLKNPLGLIKSNDQGQTIDKLAFYGETDFHYLSAGYESRQLFVINQEPNSKLETGLYSSSDEGKNWNKRKMSGIDPAKLIGLAAHPANENLLAINSQDGIFISEDGGDTFSPISQGAPVTSVLLNDKTGIYSSLEEDGIRLIKFNLQSHEEVELSVPSINTDNPIMFITQNPKNQSEMTIVTYKNDIYRTSDSGKNWTEIMDSGKPE